MKSFALLAAVFLVISCSSDKVSDEKKQQTWIDGIAYGIDNNKLYLIGILETEINSCIAFNNFGDCEPNNCWIINSKYSIISLKNLDICYIKDYLWIIDEDTIPLSGKNYNVNYGEHFVKLVLVDTFGDSLSESAIVQIDEPLKIAMLSPVDYYEAEKNETLEFQYRINGIDTWEAPLKDTVYISTDKNVLVNDSLLWEQGRALKDKLLKPPLNEQVYYWGVKASNQDTTFYSEIRSVWIKNLAY